MNQFLFLILVFLLACSKGQNRPIVSEKFSKMQRHMWKQDSTVFFLQ
jgi:hypothetical protein